MTPFPTIVQLEARLSKALQEDLSSTGDVTSLSIFEPIHQTTARIVAKEEGVIAGLPVIEMLFAIFDSKQEIKITLLKNEGDYVNVEDVIAKIEGPTISLLSVERTMLNFLQRMSGVATVTQKFVKLSQNKIKICDTRKTTPLWRDLEKYAVQIGGGTNHRMGLYDMIMIKDTHADAVGGLKKALDKVSHQKGKIPIAVETRNLEEVRIALDSKVDLIMLDNMSNQEMANAIKLIDKKIEIEVTGNVTLERVQELAKLGADRISIGSLTHSVKALDLSMRTY